MKLVENGDHFSARIVSEKEFADYRAQVYSERPENADKLFQTVLDYQVEVSLSKSLYSPRSLVG